MNNVNDFIVGLFSDYHINLSYQYKVFLNDRISNQVFKNLIKMEHV